MSNRPRVLTVLARTAIAFVGAVLVWLLLVSSFGAGPFGATLVGLAAIVAFTSAIAPSVACVVLSHARPSVLLLTPFIAVISAFCGLLAFHWLLQLFASRIPWVLAEVAPRAQAAGSVVVWAVLSASMLLVTLASHAPKRLRVLSALASAGLAVGLGMWIRALGL